MRSLILLCLLILIAAPASYAQSPEEDVVTVPVNVSIWRGISISDLVMSGREDQVSLHHFTLALPYGEGDYLKGIALGLAGTAYKESAHGLQAGGIGNIVGENFGGIQLNGLAGVVGEDAVGLQLSGLGSIAGGSVGGIQTGGLVSISGGGFRGIQSGGLASISGEDLAGIQIAGLASITGENMTGIQTSGFASIAGGQMRGLQLAGFASIAGEESTGIQAAGFASIASDISGIQLGGFATIAGDLTGAQFGAVNVVGELRGFQLGVVNITGEDPEGISIGLFTRVVNVPVNLETSFDETLGVLLSVQSGSEFFKNYVGIGARPFGSTKTRWDIHAGFGIERPVSENWYAGVDLLAHTLISESFNSPASFLLRLRAPVSHRFSNGNAVFVAPSFNLLLAHDENAAELAPYSLIEAGENHPRRGWFGLSAGLRLPIKGN